LAAVVVAGMVVVAVLTGHPGIVASFAPLVIGVVVAVWHRFNGEFGTVVAAAPDGLRLRSGLVQTTAETIRPGRVQAVRLVEPLVWRAFGWCRLEVDVAGARQRRENRPEAQRLRALIPVGSRAEAERMVGESIRWTQGPVQRRLGLASVRLDVAGRRVTASIQDRGAAEADDLLGRLPDLARAARVHAAR
jgi:uncharacterized membrane protein YdbT with pleckstrin-like domain